MSSNHIVVDSHFLARLLSRGGEAELLSAADRLDIMDLVHTVGWCIDAHSYEVLAQIITEKFQLDMATEKLDGRTKFIEFLKNGKRFQGLRHQNTNILMRSIDLTNAIAVSHLSLIKVSNSDGDSDGNTSSNSSSNSSNTGNTGNTSGTARNSDGLPVIVVQAVCTDVLKSEKDIWKLAKRTIDQMSVSSSFVADAATRENFAMTAKERRDAAQATSK
jgi:hypothetical protein